MMPFIAARIRVLFALFALSAVVFPARGQDVRCDICGQIITDRYTHLPDMAVGGQKTVCEACFGLPDRCFLCNLPVRGDGKALTDGRLLCARCAKDEISSEEDAKAVAFGVRDDLNRLFS